MVTPPVSAQEDSGLAIRGDLRVRHETIDRENADIRNMGRLRARANLTAKASDTVTLVFGVASGQTNEPISTNQTMTGGFSDKQLWLDLAYFDWTAGKKWLNVMGGKMKNPMYQAGLSQIVWDSDVNPEGLGVKLTRALGGTGLFVNGAYFFVEERPTDDDSYVACLQTGMKTPVRGTNLTYGAGFVDYLNTRGFPTFVNTAKSYGNSIDAEGKYLCDYRIAQFFGEVAFPTMSAPLLVYGECARNVARDVEDDTAWVLGLNVGGLTKPGSWMARWQYQYTERDAVVGAFTNSEIGGAGTNVKGYAIGADILVSPRITVSTTLYLNECGVKNGLTYNRFLADFTFRF
jgi:hypothetical protein